MSSPLDVSHAISLHPYPALHIHHSSDHDFSPGHLGPHARKNGASTALEQPDHRPEHGDAVSRRSPSAMETQDLEREADPELSHHNDPLHLSSKLKTAKEIDSIRHGVSRRSSLVGSLKIDKGATQANRVQEFYKDQNENIERLLKPVDEHRREAREENDTNALQYKLAVNLSFAANIILAVLQLYAAIASGSLSLFTTMADALFDPLSNVTLILCNRAVKNVNPRKFPQGKARIETAGNIYFCFLMFAVSAILLVTSAREIAEGSTTKTTPFYLTSVIAVAVAFFTKLALFFYCFSLRNRYSQVRLLWEDHRNDLIINGCGVATSVLGSKVLWWIDPAGAIALSILIAMLWLRTAWSETQLLIGTTADPSVLQHITYIGRDYTRPEQYPWR